MEGETPAPPPAKMARGNQPPPAEVEGEIQQQPAEVEGEPQQPPAKMEGEALPLPACVSKVLDDDNLLTEIIVRVGFPTSLVRAAAVCRRWLRLASDRAFLRRFRKLHPPRLLGFYIAQREHPDPAESFFSMLPQPTPPELAAMVRRTSFRLDTYNDRYTDMLGCWNGRVVTRVPFDVFRIYNHSVVGSKLTFVVHNPLCSDRGMTIFPALHLQFQESSMGRYGQLFSNEEGDAVPYFYVKLESTRDANTLVQVYMLRNGDDAWRTHHFTVDYLIDARATPRAVHVDNKIYVASTRNEIVVLDLTASSFSTIQLPQGVDFLIPGTVMLSPADDASAVYLIHVKELQLYIWLHKGGNWLLVDNICLREMCAPFVQDEPTALIQINHMGDYTGEFLFLELGRYALYLDVKCRTLRKVHEMTKEDECFGNIYPFMMIWPPIFPVLKDGPARFASLPSDDLYNALVEVT